MFQQTRPRSRLSSALAMAEVTYHVAVRQVRKSHGNALVALAMNMLQVVILVLAFYVMFVLLGLRGSAIRGDFLIYIMTGIFLYMTHVKAMGAVSGADGPTSPMMQHAPMNPIISVCAAMLSTLYIQALSVFVILFAYDVGWGPIEIYDPIGCLGMMLLAWFTGGAVGLVLLAIKPWAPTFVSIFSTIYQRANMIASGKMFVANQLPGYMIAMFNWNPLFHTIDQSRGYAFKNYFPHNSNLTYPIWFGIAFLMIGLMGEFYTRKHASASWGAKR